MDRKAIMMLKMPIYLIISLLVGVLVVAGFMSITSRALNNIAEQVTAKDIGLTIMTISASPYDVVYSYEKNTEPYEIRIADGKVKVISKEGSGEYAYYPMRGITVEDAILTNVLTVPLTLKKGVLSFSDQTISYQDACAQIPQTFAEDKIRVKVTVDNSDQQVMDRLNEIKAIMQLYTTNANSAVEFVDSNEDLSLELGTSTVATPQIMYYENSQDLSFSWYYRIACYLKNNLDNAKTGLGIPGLLPVSEEKIRIDFGNTADFIKKTEDDKTFTASMAREIYNALGQGISD
jgi:hypothetical protein